MRHYQIVIFMDNRGVCRKITVKAWVVASLLAALAVLTAADVYLAGYYLRYARLREQYDNAEKDLAARKAQLGELAAKAAEVASGLSRVTAFDAKLRAMIGIDHDPDAAKRPSEAADKAKDDPFPSLSQEISARRLAGFLQRLRTQASQAEVSRQELMTAVQAGGDMLSAAPTVWPVEGVIFAEFGPRASPVTGKPEFLRAVEISAPAGTPVHAPAKGKVVSAASEPGVGQTLAVAHGGSFTTVYANLQNLAVKEGQSVEKGQILAQIGPGGKLTGPILRYEVRFNGVPVNPKRYVIE
ncbi:MAG: M23 family metallopeptidase [Desulfovibrionaceae bacterium]|nr:M23 family metallopeptidase [Desulfovibrionaceae bacterium]MBF0512741.1 M23 family metallopeptidase [Desulfovibrionaceae bacterium]